MNELVKGWRKKLVPGFFEGGGGPHPPPYRGHFPKKVKFFYALPKLSNVMVKIKNQ